MPDYAQKARALRAKAADPVVLDVEREALLAKARELEAKYGNSNSPSADDTTVTSRDGRGTYSYDFTVYAPVNVPPHMSEYWARYMQNLVNNQWQWNSEYYDKDGNSVQSDQEDIVEDMYQYQYDDNEDCYDPEDE